MDKIDFSIEIYRKARSLSQGNNQTVGENNDYYITLQQLEYLLSNNQ